MFSLVIGNSHCYTDFCCPPLSFPKVDDLILVAETESDTVRQKVTTQIIGAVLVQCCCNAQMKENYLPVAIRVFHFLDKKIKNLRACQPAEVRCRQCGEGIFFVLKTVLRRFLNCFYWRPGSGPWSEKSHLHFFSEQKHTHLWIVPLRITLINFICVSIGVFLTYFVEKQL